MNESVERPIIALSAKWFHFPDRFRWIVDNDLALEYSPNPDDLGALPQHVTPLLSAGLPVRFHGFFPDHDIGHRDADLAEHGLRLHLAALNAMRDYGEPVITVHIGLRKDVPIDTDRALDNLCRLVEHAHDAGITVCLENLRRGPTSHPENVIAWARKAGAMITLDIGHAVSCQRVKDGDLTPVDFVRMFSERLYEVHMYEREEGRHHPPQDMTILGPIVDRLLTTRCTWWTIELEDYAEALFTRWLLLGYLTNGSLHTPTADDVQHESCN
jgi:sugar phosphate isomerase/epimerase